MSVGVQAGDTPGDAPPSCCLNLHFGRSWLDFKVPQPLKGPFTDRCRPEPAEVGGVAGAVHIGARAGALAGAGEILVSSRVKDLTAGSGLVFEDAGEHELKGVPHRWHLYRVLR